MTIAPPEVSTEQTCARYPDEGGYVERDGVRTLYEKTGASGARTCR